MKKFLSTLVACAALCLIPLAVQADDCVAVDVEVTPVASENDAGVEIVEFSIELTNCGTEPSLVGLQVVLSSSGPQVIPPFQFHFPVGAGETVARSWKVAIPPVLPPGTYELCVTATSGEASDTDCVTVEITDGDGSSSAPARTETWAAGSANDECVAVDIELTPVTLEDQSGLEYVEFSLELTNCGPDPALVGLTFELNLGFPGPPQPFVFYFPVGAGETVAHSWTLPIPAIVPAGTYGICVTATIGEASDSDCAEITVGDGNGASSLDPDDDGAVRLNQNYPNPFNIETGITFSLTSPVDVTLEVYNILGERVATLTSGSYEAGDHTVIWDGRNHNGATVSTGVYFYRLAANGVAKTRKMILVK